MTRIIAVNDVGPVHHLEIPVPDGGGVVVLRGLNGTGKSHALDAVSALVAGGKKPPSRDGSLGAQIEGLGVRLTVGRRASASGELEVRALDGLDPSLLVDPGIKDASAADAARVRALLRLSRASIDASAFAHLVGGDERLRELCRPASLQCDGGDVPAIAAAIKRDLEQAARKNEQAAENLRAKAAGVRATLKELGGGEIATAHESAEEARTAHTKAVREHAALESGREQAARLARAAAEARAALEQLGDDGTERAIANAEAACTMAADACVAADNVVAELEKRLGEARADAAIARRDAEAARKTATAQRKASEQRASLQRTIDATQGATEVSDEQIEQAAEAIASASVELERWAIRERTAAVLADARRLEQESDGEARAGASLREAARGTEEIVLKAVHDIVGDGIKLQDGRLYVATDRGLELYCELSHGERWKLALHVATKAVGDGGLLVVRQEAWESLDPPNRQEVAALARAQGVALLTAEAADGELRAEVQA